MCWGEMQGAGAAGDGAGEGCQAWWGEGGILLCDCLTTVPPLATQSFTAPRSNQDVPAPANFSQRGYYLTLRANRGLYLGGQARGQLRVLRVGNDTHCQPTKIGCNHPLPGPGPYR